MQELINIVHLFVLERRLHGSPAGLVARYMVDPDPRKFSEGVKLFQHTLLRSVLQHLVELHWARERLGALWWLINVQCSAISFTRN